MGTPSLRTGALRPEIRWLLLSSMGCRYGPRALWQHGATSSLPVRIAKTVVGTMLGWPGIRAAARRAMWRRINPDFVEVAFGSANCVCRDPLAPDRVFKVDLRSCFHPPGRQIEFVRGLAADYAALRTHLGEYLEATHFEQRNVGTRGPCWVVGASQRWVEGEAFQPERAIEPDLRRQWREICAGAMRAGRDTGRWLDATGTGNVLIERRPGARARLVIVDTLPMPALGAEALPVDRAAVELIRRRIVEGACA